MVIYINNGKYENYPEIPIEKRNDFNEYIYFNEKFIPITDNIVPDIYDWYLISNYGRIYHKYLGIFMKPYMRGGQNKDYMYIVLRLKSGKYRSIAIHRLVLACFYPNLGTLNQKMDVNHKDGIKTNNYISYNDNNRGNLEWSSRQENIIHSYNNGLHGSEENSALSKISKETAIKIVNLLSENKYTINEISEIVGENTTPSIVQSIKNKESWKSLSEGYEFEKRKFRNFTEYEINNFCLYFQNNKDKNKSINDICREALIYYGFEPSYSYIETLRKIYKRKYYTNISSQYNY